MSSLERVSPSWSRFFEKRREIHRLYGSIWKIPLLRKRARLILPLVAHGARVLDVGGGEREWETRLRASVPGVSYASVEIDPAEQGEFGSLDEVPADGFDVALLLEVIEHLPFDQGLRVLSGIHRALKPGGRIIASTPNVYCPWRFLEDATHRTPYSYECLGGALLLAGFRVESLHRAHNASLVERVGRGLAGPFHRLIGIDYARTIFAVARKT